MTDPYTWPDPAPPSRVPRVMAFVALFGLGFVLVLGVLFLRAPRALDVATPPGYVRIPDAESGGGELGASRAARLLGVERVDGFRRGVLRAWRRAEATTPRAVVALAVEQDSAERARTLHDATVAALASRGATAFDAGPGFAGYREPDGQGRYAQRVVFRRGDTVYVVSVLTPAPDADTSEAVRLAEAQAA